MPEEDRNPVIDISRQMLEELGGLHDVQITWDLKTLLPSHLLCRPSNNDGRLVSCGGGGLLATQHPFKGSKPSWLNLSTVGW